MNAQDSAKAEVSGSVSRIGDATHLEFVGQKNWDYEVSRVSPNKIKITVPLFDVKTLTQLSAWRGQLIKKVTVNENKLEKVNEVYITLRDENIESFDYLTDQPSRLIVDFFVKKEGSAAFNNDEAEKKKKIAKKNIKAKTKKRRKTARRKRNAKGQRKPAASELLEASGPELLGLGGRGPKKGVFDGGDPEFKRFWIAPSDVQEEAIIASRQNIYIRFPMLKMTSSRLKDLLDNPPIYKIKSKDTRENKEARFLHVLYKNKRYASFLKTYKFFVEKYPDSIYDEIVSNMAAQVYYRLWMRDGFKQNYESSRKIYKKLSLRYPDSVLKERNSLIQIYSEVERQNAIESIQMIQDFFAKYPKSQSTDQLKKALGETYLVINKFKEAMSIYQDLEKNAKSVEDSIEAAYRKGDVRFSQRRYKEAISLYKEAISKHPEYKSVHPNAYYNMAESQFWLGKFQPSLENFIQYLKYFPSDSYGGYAMTRVGELLEILGADKRRVMAAFLESYFRFRSNPGSEVARIRLLSQRMKGMKENELKKSLEEMHNIAKNSTLPRMPEFATLMISDGIHRRGGLKESLDLLINYYQQNPTQTNIMPFRRRILRSITDLIKEDLDNEKGVAALKIFDNFSKTWLKNAGRIDTEYFLGRAYEQTGVFDESETYYRNTLKRLKSIANSQEEKERKVNEHLPTIEAVNLRLASVTANKRMYKKASDHLRAIKNLEKLDERQQVERVEVEAKVAEERGQLRLAKQYLKDLTKTWKGEPSLLASTYLKLAKLNYQTDQNIEAIKAIEAIDKIHESGKLIPEMRAASLELKGDVYLKRGKKVAAVEAYMNLLDEFEEKSPLASIRYRAGQILFSKGDIKGAERVWSKLDKSKSSMYVKIAQEKLKDAKWQDDYKRYIERIPAAVDLKRSAQ